MQTILDSNFLFSFLKNSNSCCDSIVVNVKFQYNEFKKETLIDIISYSFYFFLRRLDEV